jgi:dolichyl-phosphate-mannose--protein O-mannosyl transferase
VDLNLPYAADCKYYLLRGVSAAFSTGAVALMYACARRLGCSVLGGALAALLMCLDGLGVGEGRLILMDAQLSFWLMATLYGAQRWWARLNATEGGAHMSVGERYSWCALIGALCGAAIGVKMTGLVTPALVALESYLAIWQLRKPVPFRQLLAILAVSLAVYSLWFAISFNLMTRSGPLKMEQEFMTPLVRARAAQRCARRARRPSLSTSPPPHSLPSSKRRSSAATRTTRAAPRCASGAGARASGGR